MLCAASDASGKGQTMSDLFQAIASIPDLIIGLWTWPKTTVATICGAIVIAGTMAAMQPDEPVKIEQPIVAPEEPVEPAKHERRIVRFAKWLWAKE